MPLGGAFTPSLVFLVFQVMNWRHAFELFGAIGLVWAFFFYRGFGTIRATIRA